MWNIFLFKDIVRINDSLLWFKEILQNSHNEKYNIYFDFDMVESSLKEVKRIILENYQHINFSNLYFYNANDFINFVLEKPIYLPNNINLFINEGCVIGCTYCDNINDSFNTLSIDDIKNFLSRYPLGDNINYNIIWQWDPLFHPQLFKILEYIKSIGWHVTFFSWWKSLLYCNDMTRLEKLIDEFKINISSSNSEVYNLTHRNKISKEDFSELLNRFKLIARKSTFITILNEYNIRDLGALYTFVTSIHAFWFEIKKNLFYRDNDILKNERIYEKIIQLINLFSRNKQINITTNIISGEITYHIFPEFLSRQISLLDLYVNKKMGKISIEEINSLNACYQFWNSIDLIEKWLISLCCKYEVWNISDICFDGYYYNNPLFKEKYVQFSKQTPDTCKECPMPIDRYRNYLKFKFIKTI